MQMASSASGEDKMETPDHYGKCKAHEIAHPYHILQRREMGECGNSQAARKSLVLS
jgi:hypothetical protein